MPNDLYTASGGGFIGWLGVILLLPLLLCLFVMALPFLIIAGLIKAGQ